MVESAIAAAWSDSVWQNYELNNIVWSANPPAVPPACEAGSPGCQVTTTPQLTQSMNPSTAVANTILETYIQDHEFAGARPRRAQGVDEGSQCGLPWRSG